MPPRAQVARRRSPVEAPAGIQNFGRPAGSTHGHPTMTAALPSRGRDARSRPARVLSFHLGVSVFLQNHEGERGKLDRPEETSKLTPRPCGRALSPSASRGILSLGDFPFPELYRWHGMPLCKQMRDNTNIPRSGCRVLDYDFRGVGLVFNLHHVASANLVGAVKRRTWTPQMYQMIYPDGANNSVTFRDLPRRSRNDPRPALETVSTSYRERSRSRDTVPTKMCSTSAQLSPPEVQYFRDKDGNFDTRPTAALTIPGGWTAVEAEARHAFRRQAEPTSRRSTFRPPTCGALRLA